MAVKEAIINYKIETLILGVITMRKKTRLICSGIILFVLINGLNAGIQKVMLNNGQEVEVSEVVKRRKTYKVKLVSPTMINTPAGKLKLKEWINFNRNRKIKSMTLSEPQEVDTPVGKVKIKGWKNFSGNGWFELPIKDRSVHTNNSSRRHRP